MRQTRTESKLTGTDALTVLECIRDCLACRSSRELTALFGRLGLLLPFDHALAVISRLEGNRAVTVGGINFSFPEGWVRAYTAADSFARDGLVHRALAGHAAQYWAEASPRLPRPNALSLCRDFRLRQGWVVGAAPRLGDVNSDLFCFAAQTGRRDGRAEAVLEHLLPHLQAALRRAVLGAPEPDKAGIALSAREKEVLSWLMEGKGSWDIGMLLGIRERTVNFHIANILRKLDATNRTQAVAVALQRGLLALA